MELAAQLASMGRQREALQQLEAGAKRFPHDWRLDDALLQAYERDGCWEEALCIQRRRLEARPDVQHYAATLVAAERAGRDGARYREELHRWAEAQEAEPALPTGHNLRRRVEPSAGPDVSVRVQWLLHEARSAEALALVQQPRARLSENAALALARGLLPGDPGAACTLIERIFQQRMRRAQSPYAEELALVRQWCGCLSPADAGALLARLRLEYKAKRNFVVGLRTLAGP
jgi:hypothetical protein